MLPPAAINEGTPVTPRPSATVLLVRGEEPWELLLVHRPGGADFAPGAYVFPGGTVHEDDRESADAIAAAAVRELFEEVGILLARRASTFARDADSAQVRALVEGGSSFGGALRELGLTPAFDSLVMFARWVTPAQLSRRFDARFYLARMPEGQSVRAQEGEVTDWRWASPRRALDSPEITLVYATRAVLESVVDTTDAQSLFARARAMREIPVVEPRIVRSDSGWEIVRD
ncbi:MAG TPA: NUDIX hydrolase [Candidatus Limnocylindrales bacterium]|nr:NUDIX hydrolase [Candidatus Limnocylindrales bacterium]